MPRIKRWFPVSHDINRDPEFCELSRRFGATGIRVWLELLSIADRNDGDVPGSYPPADSPLTTRRQPADSPLTTRHQPTDDTLTTRRQHVVSRSSVDRH